MRAERGVLDWSFAELDNWYWNVATEPKGGDGRKLTREGHAVIKSSGNFHEKTLAAWTKIAARTPGWAKREAKGASRLLGVSSSNSIENFLAPERFKAGVVNVVRVNDVSPKDYALFSVSLMKYQLKGRASGEIEPWIVNIIDEAQDIFNGEESLRKVATPAFEEITRKGRSKHVGSVFCVQSFTEVPKNIVNFCNSRIVMRHGSKDIAKQGLDGDDFGAVQTTGFKPGDAFVRLYGSPTFVLARMLPSPFLITKEQNPDDYAE
jgi:hypothetical protein